MRVLAMAVSLWVAACSGGGGEPTVGVAGDEAFTTFAGADAGDHLAASVTGDFDADGKLDIALASTGADGPEEDRADAGEVQILFDFASLGDNVDLGETGAAGASFFGPYPAAALGRALSVGDFNGDSVDDLAMSAPLGVDPATGTDSAGVVYIHFGMRSAAPMNIDLASASVDVSILGEDPGDGAGLTLVSSDYDDDGIDDLLIGAHLADGPDNQRPEAGEAYVVSGGAIAAENALPAVAAATLIGGSIGDHLSEAMTTGDFNVDGVPDLVIAATFADVEEEADSGRTYVLQMPLPGGVTDLATSTEWITAIGGADAGDQMGHSIAAGDWDNDGIEDAWLGSVSADGENNAEDLAGEARLFLIKPETPRELGVADAQALVLGPSPEARLGRNAASSQFDGDAGHDLAIAATDVLERRGEVYILAGGPTPPERANDAALIYRGRNPDDVLGHEAFGNPSLSGEDLDSDGVSELIVASPGSDGPDGTRSDCGEVYLIRPKRLKE